MTSATRGVVAMNSTLIAVYTSRILSVPHAKSEPTKGNGGFWKSSIDVPSRINSGFETTAKSSPFFLPETSSISFATRSYHQGQTGDRRATTCLPFCPTTALAIAPATLKTASRSRCPVGVEGVPTQMKEIVVPWIASATLFIAEILPRSEEHTSELQSL